MAFFALAKAAPKGLVPWHRTPLPWAMLGYLLGAARQLAEAAIASPPGSGELANLQRSGPSGFDWLWPRTKRWTLAADCYAIQGGALAAQVRLPPLGGRVRPIFDACSALSRRFALQALVGEADAPPGFDCRCPAADVASFKGLGL